MVLRWKAAAGAAGYEIQIANDPRFTHTLVQESVEGLSFKVELPAGRYYFRVKKKSGSKAEFPWSRFYLFSVADEGASARRLSLPAPQWESPDVQVPDEGAPARFRWSQVPGAAYYHLIITPAGNGASLARPQDIDGIQKNEYALELPPGKYMVKVAAESHGAASSFTAQSFQLDFQNPNRFSRTELFIRYAYTQLTYDNFVIETLTDVPVQTLPAGSILVKGNLWFREPHLGLRFSSLFGGFNFNSNVISYSDAQLALAGRYKSSETGNSMEFRPYFGVRAWSMPIIRPFPTSSSSELLIFNPILLGPVLGADFIQPLTDNLALEVDGQISIPVANSVLGTDHVSQVSAEPVGDARVQAGFSYRFNESVKALAAFEYAADTLQWSASSSDKSRVDLTATSEVLGVQVADEPGTSLLPGSDFRISAMYRYRPLHYTSTLNELQALRLNPSVDFQTSFAGSGELEGVRWTHGGTNGLRLMTEWSGMGEDNNVFTFPEFEIQWGWRPLPRYSPFQIENFLGARVWAIPVIFGIAQTSNTRTAIPSLVGPVDTIFLKQSLGSAWSLNVMGEVSSPLDALGKDSYVTKIHWENMSYKSEVTLGYRFNPFFSMEAGGGYSLEQYRYNFAGGTDANASTVVASGPLFSLSAAYRF